MKIKNISFLTPLANTPNFKLEKECSQKFILPTKSFIQIHSAIGPKETQQDSVLVMEHHGYLIMAVADGMGGLKKGEEASYKILKNIKEWFEMQSLNTLQNINGIRLERIIYTLIENAKNKDFPDNAGTTLNLSMIGPYETYIINIGDSRAYTTKNNEITLRTHDDSLAFCLFGPQTKEDRDKLRFYSKNNIITNYIEKSETPYVVSTRINNDDYDILCHITDGVSDMLSEDTIKKYLLDKNPATSLVKQAINSELEYNTDITQGFSEFIYPHDNATAIVYSKRRKLI